MESSSGATPDLLVGLTPPDLQLDIPDMDRARQERRTRTENIMKVHNPTVTKGILPQSDERSSEDVAATKIQATYRGHLGRKQYIEELYKLYEKEEAMRLEKTIQQVEEGQLLVENHRLEVQLDDNSTTRRNKSRQYLTHIITIQRAWRRHKESCHQSAALSSGRTNSDSNMSPALSEADDHTDESESSNGHQAMSVSSPEDSDSALLRDYGGFEDNWQPKDVDILPKDGTGRDLPPGGIVSRPLIEAEPDSTVSDYSEMAESIKEHLANIQVIHKEDLQDGNTEIAPQMVANQKIIRDPNETDEEFTKRVRKINYLSLAQEFAALKKIDSSALPFNIHRIIAKDLGSPMSDSSATETDSSEKYLSESAGPSNAATPIDCCHEFLSHDNEETPFSRNDNDPSTDVDGLTDKFHGANMTSRQAWPEEPPGGVSITHQETPGGKLDNEPNEIKTSNFTKSSNLPSNDAFHDQNTADKKSTGTCVLGDFDVYNIETALPQMNWDLLEEQLHRAAEEERLKKESRRNDREEIRRKLAMAGADEEYYGGEKIHKKPNFQTRLQSGMNLQICFLNEASVENEAAKEGGRGNSISAEGVQGPGRTTPVKNNEVPVQPSGGSIGVTTEAINPVLKLTEKREDEGEEDFFARQTRLQTEARMALAQVRPMAHMQLEVEKQMRKKSPIAEIVGIPGFGDGKRRKLGLHMLKQMNIAQLQVVVNDLHGQIASLNEELVRLLVERDDLHMAQDSMLVDIEDLTRYCAVSQKNPAGK